MNILDFLIIIMLAAFIYIGFKKGLVSELIQTIALVSAFLVAAPIGKWLSSILADNYHINKDMLFFASTIAAFIAVLSSIAIIGNLLSSIPPPGAVLSITNKISGAVFGVVKGFLVITLVVFIIRITPFSAFITDNIDYTPRVEKDIYDLDMLKNAVSSVKEKVIYLSTDSINKDIIQKALTDSVIIQTVDSTSLLKQPAEAKNKAKLGYLAYKLSTTMDPALESYKKYLFIKIDKALEAVTQPDNQQLKPEAVNH